MDGGSRNKGIIKSGKLQKKGQLLWNWRYFELYTDRICYYDSQLVAEQGKRPRAFMILTPNTRIENGRARFKKIHTIALVDPIGKSEHVIGMLCKDGKEYKDWWEVLDHCISAIRGETSDARPESWIEPDRTPSSTVEPNHKNPPQEELITLKIHVMSFLCDHCDSELKEAFRYLKSIKDIRISTTTDTIQIIANANDLDMDSVRNVIQDCGLAIIREQAVVS